MFPSILNTFNRPTASDRLNSPSHSALHNTVSSALGQVEAVIGLSTTSLLGTLFYDIRSSDSNGGGHVQTANKGGTGQISYTKGDILVATTTSVLSKLAIGSDGQILVANSSTASGVNWVNNNTSKVSASVLSSVVGSSTVNETSIFSVSIPGSTLGINNAVRAIVDVRDFAFAGTTASVMVMGVYGGARIASVLLQADDITPGSGLKGKIEFTLFGNGTVTAQSGDLFVNTGRNSANLSSFIGNITMDTGTASVQSSANQNIGITARYSTADGNNRLRIGGITIEKIV